MAISTEHLGRCIYDGFWVSDTSTLKRKDRIRLDVVEALKKIKIPNLRWPADVLQMNIIGGMVSVRDKTDQR
jgi:alpha-L-arabinofuranosidase